MAITLDKIKFYPHSLPARPFKHTSGNPHIPFPHSSKRADPIPFVKSKPLLSSLSQIATPPSLPPRPPSATPSSHDSARATPYLPPNTSCPVDCKPMCPNDFDRMLDGFGATAQGENDINGDSSIDPPRTGNEEPKRSQINLPDRPSQQATGFASSRSTVETHIEPSAKADQVAPCPQNPPEPRDHPDYIATTASSEAAPISCTLEKGTTASDRDGASSDTVTKHSSLGISDQISHINGTPYPSVKPTASGLQSRIFDSQDLLEHSKLTTACQSADHVTQQRTPSVCVSRPPTPLVVVPAPSRSVLSRRSSRQLDSEKSQCPDWNTDDANESGSAPSDDENDADYVDDGGTREADRRSFPSKRRRINPGARSSSFRREARQSTDRCSSEPAERAFEQVATRSQTGSAHTKSVDSFAKLHSHFLNTPLEGRLEFLSWLFEGAFCKGMSDPDLALSPSSASMTPGNLDGGWSQSKSTDKKPWTVEEEDLLVQLRKEERLSWSTVEQHFAEKFPGRRSPGAIQVHWSSKMKGRH